MGAETKTTERAFATLTMWRHPETQRAYNLDHKQEVEATSVGIASAACRFCNFELGQEGVLEAQPGFTVVAAKYPYDHWDAREVRDHRMVIPTRHVDGLKELTTEEKLAWFDIVGDYEERGYTSFTRSPESPTKSVDHLHTHLFRIDMGSRAVRYMHYDGGQGVNEFRFAGDEPIEAVS